MNPETIALSQVLVALISAGIITVEEARKLLVAVWPEFDTLVQASAA